MGKNYLIEVTPVKPDGQLATIRMSRRGVSNAGVNLDNKAWLPLLETLPTFSLNLMSSGQLQIPTISYGDLEFICSKAYGNEEWSSYDWSNALASCWYGEDGDPFSQYTQVFSGRVSGFNRQEIYASVALLGSEADLQRPALFDEYEGTGGLEGGAGIKGTLKPRAHGFCRTVSPVQIDTVYLVYQVHGYGPIAGISKVYDFAQELDPAIANVSTYTELIALDLQPGQWATCNAHGLFRLGGSTDKKLTCDVMGALFNGVYTNTVKTITQQLIREVQPTAVFGTFGPFADAEWCFYAKDATSVADIVYRAVYEAGGYLIPDGAGRWQVGDFYAPVNRGQLRSDRSTLPLVISHEEKSSTGPVWKVSVGHSRCWSKHTESEISPTIFDASGLASTEDLEDALEELANVRADITLQLSRLDAMAADGVLDRAEKKYWEQEYARQIADRNKLVVDGSQFDVSAEIAAYQGAATYLTNYLNGLLPAWNDGTQDTPIDRVAFKAAWESLYSAKLALTQKMTGQASEKAIWDKIIGSGKPEDGATVGAPIGTFVGGTPASTIAAATVNFNTRNDRNGAAIVNPTIATNGSAIDHTINTDGSADISFEWLWSGNNSDIDGFTVVVLSSTSSAAYTLGTTPADETVYTIIPEKRACFLYGVPANRYYTFYVQAYRVVDPDINSAGVIRSTAVKSTASGENPYRPSATVAFAGNITGTVNGVAVSTVSTWGAIIDAAKAEIQQISTEVTADFTEVNQAVDALQGDVSTAQSNISGLQSTTSAVQSGVSTLNGQMTTAQGNITSLQSSTSSLNTSVSTLNNQMTTAQGSISTLQNSVGSLNTNVSGLQIQASGIVTSVSGLDTRITAQGGQINTMNSTLTSQGSSITTLQQTVSNTSGEVATLKTQINAGGGNLLTNTDLALDTSGWDFSPGGTGSVGDRVATGDQWVVTGENGLRVTQANGTTSSYADWSQIVPVEAGKWYDVSARIAAHRCTVILYIQWIDADGVALASAPNISTTSPLSGGNNLANWTQVGFKAQAPASAVRGRMILRKMATNSGANPATSYAWYIRPQVTETQATSSSPLAYSPGNARATITTQATAVSTLNSTVSTLSSTVSTQGGSITSLQSSVTTLQGSVSTLSSTVSTQGASISSLQTSVSTAQGDLATLKTQINAGGGNLLVNTDLANASSAGWAFRSQNNMFATGSVTGQPIEYQVAGENNFAIVQPNTTTNNGTAYAEWYQTFSVEGGKWYDVSGYYGAHRCTAQVYIQWVLDTGSTGSAPNTGVLPAAVTGNSLSAWARYGFKTQAPANAVRANILLRKRPTDSGSDSWVWFIRPQVAETTANSATPLAYAPGSARASIVQQAQALSALDGTLASVSLTVSTQGGSISSLQSSMTTAQGSISTLQSTVNTQGSSISSLQSTVSTATGDVATLKTQVNAGSGNLLNNPDFAVSTSGWSYGLQNGAVADFVTGADQWMVTGENGVRLFQPNATATGYSEWEQFFAVQAGKWYDTSVRVAAHRCQVQVYISWRDINNATISSPSSGQITPLTGGSLLENWTHVGFKAQAPAGAVRARIVLRKLGTLAGSSEPNSYAWWLRPQVAETYATSATPLAYSPGSSRASIDAQAQALNTATSSLATVTSTVATQGGSISTLQSSFTSLNGTVSTMSSTVSAQGSSISTLQSASSTQAGQISTLQSTVSTQGSSISTIQSTISSQGSDVATLKTQVNAGGGNLLVNTDLALDTTGWTFGTNNGATFGRNLPSSSWYPANENTLVMVQANATTTGNSDITQIIEISAGKWYDVSVYAAQHRCSAELIIQWLDSAGNANLGAPSSGQFAATGGGSALSSFVIRSFKAQAPAGAVRARFYLRKMGTNSGQTDSYAWFLRPQVVETLAGSATPIAYSPGSARATIVQQASALSTLNTSFSSLSSTVSSQGGSVATLQSSMTSAQVSISTLQSTVSSQGANISTLQSTTSTQTGQIASLNSTVSTQGSSISSLQSTVSSQGSSLSTLNTIVTASSNPNLVQNGGFENGIRGWTGGGRNPNNWSQQNWVWGYFAHNSNAWTGSASGNYAYLDCAPFGVADNGNTLTMSFDVDFTAGAGSVAYGEVVWLNSSGSFITQSSTQQVGPRSFDVTGNGRVKGTVSAPVGASTAYARVVFYAPNGVTMNSMNIRHLKVEFGSNATPYSGEATAGQMYQAYATLDSSFATLSTTVASQGGSISTLQSSFTGLNGTVSTLNSTVSAQGSSISSLQSASSTQSGQISTLQTQVRAGGGNLLNNTDFGVDTAGWSFGTSNGSVGDRVPSGDPWIVAGENGLRTVQLNTNSANQGDWTQEVAIEEGKWYDASVYAASHRANIQVYLQFINASGTVLATPSSGLIGPAGGGSTLANFVNRSFKGLAPAGAVKAKLYLRKFGTLSGSDSYAWFLRPQITETTATSASPVSYSPGSVRASISVQNSAISTLTSQQATLSSTVSTHGSTISSQATALTSLQGSVGTLQSTVSSQGASINSLQTASSTTNGNVATLTTALYAGAPNLLKYGGFQNGLAGWNAAAPWQVSSSLDQNWGRFMTINATGNRYCNTDPQPVQVGQQYTISCDIDRGGTSGGLVAARIIWRNSSGGTLGIGPTASKASGGFSNSEADRVFSSGTCPSGAVDFYVQLVVEGVTGNQYWRRIKVNTGTTPGRYSEEASVVQSFEALSTLTTQYASLSGTVSTLNSSVTTQQTAINNLNGRTSAYWETTAVAGNGRAQLTLHADANGGGGVDIVGDVRISGDTMIGGTLSVSALNYQMFVRRKSGSGSYGGQIPVGTTVLYSESLGQCSPIGSYMLELSGQYSTNAGTRSTTHNGKPLFTSYNADGGIYANLVKNGAVVATVALPVNDTGANTGGTWRVVYTSASLMEKEVTDSSIADVYLQIVAVRGGNDTGIVDDGDTYYRQLSASYSDINVSAKAKWTFI